MKNKEIDAKVQEGECEVDENYTQAVSVNTPYFTKQFKNWLIYNKGKIYSHHLKYFLLDGDKDNEGCMFSSFDQKDFMLLSHKEVKKFNANFIIFMHSKSTKWQQTKRQSKIMILKSYSEIKDKSSCEILKDMLV